MPFLSVDQNYGPPPGPPNLITCAGFVVMTSPAPEPADGRCIRLPMSATENRESDEISSQDSDRAVRWRNHSCFSGRVRRFR